MTGNRPPGTLRRTDPSIPKGCRVPSPPRNRNAGTSCRRSRCPTPRRASRGSCTCSASSVSSPEVRKIVVYLHPRAAFAPGRIVAEGLPQALGPCVVLRHLGELRRREEQPGIGLGLALVRVEAVVPYLLEPLVGDVDEQPFDEVLGALGDVLPPPLLGLVLDVVVLVRVVEPRDRHRLRVEGGYPPLRDGGVRGVPRYVVRQLRDVPGRGLPAGELRAVDVVALGVFLPQLLLEQPHRPLLRYAELRLAEAVDPRKEGVHEGEPEEVEGEEIVFVERAGAVHVPLGDEYVQVRMPLHVPPEGVEEADEAELPAFPPEGLRRMFFQQQGEGVVRGGEKGVEHRLPVLPEERPQLLRHGEDELAVGHIEAFAGDLGAPGVPVFLPAAWAHPRVAGEPHHVEIAAFRAFVVDVAVGEVVASDEALDRLDEAGPGEQAGVFLLEGGPRRLDYLLDRDVALELPGVVAVVVFPDLVDPDVMAVLLGLLELGRKPLEVGVDLEVGVPERAAHA